MATPTYTAKTRVTGGRNGLGTTSDGAEFQLKGPVELGGQGGGVNPEQLFAIGFAACFESSLRAGARRAQLDPKGTAIDSRVMLLPRGEGQGFKLGVEMDITMPNIDDQQAVAELVRAAHQVCPYSNATRGNIDVAFTGNGAPVVID